MIRLIRIFYPGMPTYERSPANIITVWRLRIALICLVWFGINPNPTAMVLVGLMMLADNLDGFIARRTRTTDFGTQFDPVVDKVVAFVTIIVLVIRMLIEPEALYIVTLVVLAFVEVAIMLTSNSAIKRIKHIPKVTWQGKVGMFFRNCSYGVMLLDLAGEGGIFDWAWPVRVVLLAAVGCCLGAVAKEQYARS